VSENLVSSLCFFKCNLYRYSPGGYPGYSYPAGAIGYYMPWVVTVYDKSKVGLYKLNPADPYILKPPGFNP
jgi:hypothetical protein